MCFDRDVGDAYKKHWRKPGHAIQTTLRLLGFQDFPKLIRLGGEGHQFAAGKFSGDFKRAAAVLAVRGETLAVHRGIHGDFKLITAKRALDGEKIFQADSVTTHRQSATAMPL